jgi:hypothetical protein
MHLDFEYFFKSFKERDSFNHGLIACLNDFDEKSVNFIKKYANEANLNGIVDKDYLDTIPQNYTLIKQMDDIMDETEDYRFGSFLFKFFADIDLDTLTGIKNYASRMLIYFSDEYRKYFGADDSYMNEGWHIVGQFLYRYYRILQLIPKARKTKYPLKFLYYGRPTNAAYFFFYILVKNYCDVVVVSPSDFDYKKATSLFIHDWLDYNIFIDNFESR